MCLWEVCWLLFPLSTNLSSPQLSATRFMHVQFHMRFPFKTPAFLFLSGCSLNTDWDVINMFLILNYFFNSWEYQACISQLPWLLEEVGYIPIPHPSHIKHTWALQAWEKTGRIAKGICISVDAFTSLQCHRSRMMMDEGFQQIMQEMGQAGRIPIFL